MPSTASDPVLAAIENKVAALGYTTKLETADQLRSYDEPNLPFVLISSLKRPTVGWMSTAQPASGRLYRLILAQKSDLTVSKPLESTGIEDQFKLDMISAFQGIDYTTFSGTSAWDSSVIDDDNFDASKAAIAYNYSTILVSIQCLEVGAVG